MYFEMQHGYLLTPMETRVDVSIVNIVHREDNRMDGEDNSLWDGYDI